MDIQRTTDRIPHNLECSGCGSLFTVYQAGIKGKIPFMGRCSACAARKAKVDYPNIRAWRVH